MLIIFKKSPQNNSISFWLEGYNFTIFLIMKLYFVNFVSVEYR